MIAVGSRVPEARVWIEPDDGRDRFPIAELATAGPFLLLFYLYDWTGT